MNSGWETKTLGDVCVVDWGNTNLTKSSYIANGEYLAVSAAGCDGRIGHAEHKKYTPVLSAIGAQCGRMFFPEEDFTAIKNTITLTPKQNTDSKFLFYLLTAITLPQRGAGQPFISKGDIQKFAIVMPSLHEQQRIVAVLDEAFAGIQAATDNAKKNLQNARELFESHLQSIFTTKGDGWVEKTLGDVCILKSGTTLPPSIERQCAEIAYLKVADMTLVGNSNGIETSTRFVNREDIKDSALLPAGTTIFPKRGGAILTNKKRLTKREICADLNIMGVIPGKSLLPEFLYLYFLGVDMRKLGSGTTIPQINNYDIAPLLISFPSIPQQQRIVAQLDTLSTETKRLEAIYQQKLNNLAALKQSILQKAFAGELNTDKLAA